MDSKPFNGQDYEKLKLKAKNSNRLFVDDLFPPNNTSLCFSNTKPKFMELGIVWKRPKEISNNAVFVIDGFNRLSINQGYLGNCWFIAGMIAMVKCPYALNRVIPNYQSFDDQNYAGIFHFRFWRYGEWFDVVIDDFLPYSTVTKTLAFCHNEKNPDEFWQALLEKAYAKFNGNYQKLDGGTFSDALVDMSGGVIEEILINESDIKIDINELWIKMYQSIKKNSMIGCGIKDDNEYFQYSRHNGLIKNHGYTITKLALINVGNKNIKLIRIKNPFGEGKEWNGAWSDHSSEWNKVTDKQKQDLGFLKANDGEFWMSFDDFVNIWDYINICHLPINIFIDQIKKNNEEQPLCKIYHSKWKKGINSGGGGIDYEVDFNYWNNPKIFIKINNEHNETKLVVSLTQKKSFLLKDLEREKKGTLYDFQIDLSVYKIDSFYEKNLETLNNYKLLQSYSRLMKQSGFIDTREVNIRLNLQPGIYMAIPSLDKSNVELEFMIRIFSEHNILTHMFDSTLYTLSYELQKKSDKLSIDNLTDRLISIANELLINSNKKKSSNDSKTIENKFMATNKPNL